MPRPVILFTNGWTDVPLEDLDGKATGVRQRAAEEMAATFRAAQKLGASVVSGFTGSPLWSYVAGYPGPTPDIVAAGLQDFVKHWAPVLDVARDEGVRFA